MTWDTQSANTNQPTERVFCATQQEGWRKRQDRAPRHSGRALLVFAQPANLDCRQRNWLLSFRQLFDTGRYAELAASNVDVHLFTSVAPPIPADVPNTVHVQKRSGTSFGTRLENAVAELASLGYSDIVIVGSDCPSLPPSDVSKAFRLLQHKRAVLGPDHRGGCYLIGIHADDRPDFAQICWHRNTDFAQLLCLYDERAITQLPRKIDLDTFDDLRLLARANTSAGAFVRALLRALESCHCAVMRCLAEQSAIRHLTLSWQLPPPVPVALAIQKLQRTERSA